MTKTLRQEIIEILTEEGATARDLSQIIGLREKEVYDHLAHIEKSVKAAGKLLFSEPVHCIACGYVFKNRTKIKPPGRCPECRQSRIEPPVFRIKSEKEIK